MTRFKIIKLIHEIDQKIQSAINIIKQHKQYQQLQSRWQNLHYLINHTQKNQYIKIKLLSTTEKECLSNASPLNQLICQQEYGLAGGEPFGFLLCDFSKLTQDLTDSLSSLAEQALLPVLLPTNTGRNHRYLFNITDQWNINNSSDTSTANYLILSMLINSYVKTSWFNQLQNEALFIEPHQAYGIPFIVSPRLSETDVLTEAPPGFIQFNKNNKDIHRLSELLAACRFGHYLKIIAREKIGLFTNTNEAEIALNSWLRQYCGYHQQEQDAFRYPLRSAKITITQQVNNSEHYQCRCDLSLNVPNQGVGNRVFLFEL